jgi:hypothetical protein
VYHGELDRERWGLPQARVEAYKGLIFGTWEEGAPSLEDYLGDIRWGVDVLVDQRAGGVEVVGGVFKWTIRANWKFGADNFVGDTYHGQISHRSALMIGHRDSGRWVGRGSLSRMDVPGFSIRTPFGHGLNADLRPADAAGSTNPNTLLGQYYQDTLPEVEARLGTLRARQVARINATVFPNLSLSSSSRMLHVWHPKGPQETEVWLYTLVDRDAPPEVKEAIRRGSQRHFSPSGMFEQDDGENWEQATLACRGAIARRYPINYQMGLGHDEIIDDGEAPARIPTRMSEHNQRNFYKRWAELMATASSVGSGR